MPFIRLIDGISVDEYVLDHTNTGYSAEGECVIEHSSYGTVGLQYDPDTDTFHEQELSPVDLINLLTTEELMALDLTRNTDPVRYKLVNDILANQHTTQDAYEKFKYISDAGIMEMDRIIEIIMDTRYQEVIPMLLNEAPVIADADVVPEWVEVDTNTEPEVAPT